MERVACDLCGADKPIQVATKGRFDVPLSTVMCRRCRLVYTSPRMDGGEARRYYDGEYHATYADPQGDGIDEARAPSASHIKEREEVARQRFEVLLALVDIKGKTVLDVGCGTGALLKLAAEAGGHAYGVEVAPQYAAFARDQYGVEVFTGTFEEFLAVNTRRYDVVTLYHVLEHLSFPSATLKAIRTLLKEDGALCVQVPNVVLPFVSTGADLYWFLRIPHLYNFSRRSLTNVLGSAGFRPVTLQQAEGTYLFVLARPSEPAPLQKADGLWTMLLYFKAWQWWTAQRRWRRRVREGVKRLAFAALGERRARRWAARVRGGEHSVPG